MHDVNQQGTNKGITPHRLHRSITYCVHHTHQSHSWFSRRTPMGTCPWQTHARPPWQAGPFKVTALPSQKPTKKQTNNVKPYIMQPYGHAIERPHSITTSKLALALGLGAWLRSVDGCPPIRGLDVRSGCQHCHGKQLH